MPRLRKYDCSSCGKRFEILHATAAEPPPDFCPKCGAPSSDSVTEPLPLPSILSVKTRAVDGHYRAMEEGSQHRANMAMEMGLSTEEANQLKITNLRDNVREGEISAMPVNNPVSQMMAAAPPGTVGYQPGVNGVQYSGAVQSGPYPNAGAHTMQALRSRHAQFTQDAGHAGTTTSEIPALEAVNPNYRRRV